MKTRNSLLALVVALSIAALGCAESPTTPLRDSKPVSPAETEVFKFDFSETIPGCGEDVDLDGFVHINVHINEDANGGLHGNLNVVIQGNGTGDTSGDRYNFSGRIGGHLNLNSSGGGNFHGQLNLRLRGQGQTPDASLRLMIHITANANGDAVVESLKGRLVECP